MGLRSMNYGQYQNGGNIAGDFMGGMRAGAALGDSLSSLDMQSRLNRMGNAVQQAGGDISAIDAASITSPRDMMALGAFQEQYLKTQEGQSRVYAAHNRLAEQQYNTLAGILDYMDTVKDNPDQWGAAVEIATRKLNLPHNLKYRREHGDFEVLYQGEDGKETPTGQYLSQAEVDEQSRQWRNSRTFTNAIAQHATALWESNNAAKQEEKSWLHCTDASGRELTLVPQRQPKAGGGIEVGFLVMDREKGTEFVPVEQLGEYGISMQSMEQALQNQNARLQIERNKVGLQGDRMNLRLMGQKINDAMNSEKMGPGARGHGDMLNAGYIWDKDQQWYYKPGIDADGKSHADYSQPASREFFQSTRNGVTSRSPGISGVVAGANDPLGMREQQGGRTVSQGQPVVPAEIPNTQQIPPNALPDTTISADTRQLAIVNENGVPHYYLVDSQGQREEISGDEAQRIGSRANVDWNKVVQSVQEVWNRPSSLPMPDWYEAMTVEERAQWEKNGKVPQRLRHLQ